MKKFIFITIFSLGCILGAKAQDYSTGVGLRGGWGTGLTIKHFLNESKAVEGILDSRWHGFSVTGLYEIHKQAFQVPRLNWYYGLGGHIGFWNGDYFRNVDRNTNYTIIGIDGIIGIEYNFEEIPFNIGIDWKPVFDLTGYSGIYGDGGAISLRYIF